MLQSLEKITGRLQRLQEPLVKRSKLFDSLLFMYQSSNSVHRGLLWQNYTLLLGCRILQEEVPWSRR